LKSDLANDIYEAGQSSELIKASNDFLENIMESVTNAIFVISPEEKVDLANRAAIKITGYTVDELVDKPFSTLFEDETYKKINKRFIKVKMFGDKVSQYETEMIRKDGEKFFVLLSLSSFHEVGDIVSVVVTAQDITHRKQLERDLLQAQKLESVGQLASGIAHEINTPAQYVGDNVRFLQESFNDIIELISGHNSLLKAVKAQNILAELVSSVEEINDEIDINYLLEETPKALKQSIEGIEHIASIVRAMKDFSCPEVENNVAVDINQAIANTITISRNKWKYTADIKTDFDPALPLVYCLPGEFNQVMLNLIVNASDAVGRAAADKPLDKGTITISTRQDNESVEIRIIDTGTGIPPEIRSRIFDPFLTTKGIGEGVGCGLSVCHDVIVKKYGGTITFETEIGKGTEFVVCMPIGAAEE